MDAEGAEREIADVLAGRGARQDQVGAQAGLDARAHVRVHAVADHRGAFGVCADLVQAGADHDGVRLAHEVGLLSGRRRDHRSDGAARGQGALVGGARHVGVGRDELRSGLDEADRVGQRMEVVGTHLAEHHELGVDLRHHVSRGVDRGGQAGLANHVGGRAGRLLVQERGRRVRGGPDVALGDVQTGVRQARGQVAVREHRIVGEDQEGDVLLAQSGEELVRARKSPILLDQDAVHVGEPCGDGRQIGQWRGFVCQGSHASILRCR